MRQLSESFGYILYVDEAGDEGLKSLRPENPQGSSEWMVLAGYMVRAEQDLVLPTHLTELRSHIDATQGRALHYRKLSPSKRLAATRFLASIEARAFAVCSFKRTMLGHRNERAAAASGGTNQYFYNFLVRFLLERVTEFCRVDTLENQGGEVRPIKVVFSHKGGHRYGQLKAYLEQLKVQATGGSTYLNQREIRPEFLRFSLTEYHPHFRFAGLQLADIVASAFFQAVDTSSPNWNLAPATALRPLVAREYIASANRYSRADFGLTIVPRPSQVIIDPKQRAIFENYGYIFDHPKGLYR